MCEDGEFLVHTNILKKIDKLFENFDNIYDLICHLHTLSYNEIHIEHVVFTLAAICLPIVVNCLQKAYILVTIGVQSCTPMITICLPIVVNCLQKAYILENHGIHDGVQSENRGVQSCTPMITICLPIIYRLLSIVSRKRTSWKTMAYMMVSKVKTVAYMIVIIHTYRICMPSECNISFATRDLSSGDIVNDHLAYTCRNVLIENCESFKYLRSNDVNA